MPISDDDLNYLRNINTRPGPNAGKSIDPTKPGPSDNAPPRPDASGLAKEIEELKRENKVLRAITRGAQKADASAGLIEAAKIVKGRSMACSRDSEANLLDSLEKELRFRAVDRSVHGELIPDCPTEGVAARQGNGG